MSEIPSVTSTSRATPAVTTAPAVAAPAAAVRADDAAIRALAAAIHRELRESLAAEDVVRLASALLGHVVEELAERRAPVAPQASPPATRSAAPSATEPAARRTPTA